MLPPGTTHDLSHVGAATGWLVLLGPEQLGLANATDVIRPWVAQLWWSRSRTQTPAGDLHRCS
jgi:hypothetical protein